MIFSTLLPEALMSTRSDAIIAADQDGIIRQWNPGAERIFGYGTADAIGQSLDLIVPERLRQRHGDGYRRSIETGKSRYGDGDVLAVPAVRRDGAMISIEFTVIPLRDNQGNTIGMGAIIRDVTRRFNEVRALEQKIARISEAENAPQQTEPTKRE